MSFERSNVYSMFDVLRPPAGGHVTNAIVTTYSLDFVALVGLVLALGGEADEELETGPLGLIDAFYKVKDKLKVLCQKQRIKVPTRHHSVLLLFSSMICQISANEQNGSWHPKLALVRYEGPSESSWRLWIGSRNLTGSCDFEAGILLIGVHRARGLVLNDVVDIATELLEPAELPSNVLAELRDVRWRAPAGVRVDKVWWRAAGSLVPFLSKSRRARPTLAISPFIDLPGLDALKAFSGGSSSLLTTEQMMQGFGSSLPDLPIRVMGLPDLGDFSDNETASNSPEGDFVPPPRLSGLHAKMLLQERGSKSLILIGSANLTRRGLIGPNAEIMVEAQLQDKTIAESLNLFFSQQPEYLQTEVVEDPVKQAKKLLDQDVAQLVSVEFRLTLESVGLVLNVEGKLDDFLARHQLSVCLFSHPNQKSIFVSNSNSVILYEGEIAIREQTPLVIFEAISLANSNAKRSWVQDIPFDGLDIELRNRAAIAAYVGPRRFRDWLRTVLEGIVPSETETWTGDPKYDSKSARADPNKTPFALEYVLGRWARNPDDFEMRVSEVMSMLVAFREEFLQNTNAVERATALKDLEEIEQFWTQVSQAIGTTSR